MTTTYLNTLSYYDLFFANIGYIIGAGIFVLIGQTLNIAGKLTWISIILSGLFILFISDSYIIAYKKYTNTYDITTTNTSDLLSIKHKFGNTISTYSTWLLIIASIAIIYIVILGFGSYTSSIINNTISNTTASILGLIFAICINIYGIELTAKINNSITITGIIGLSVIILLGFIYIINNPNKSYNNLVIKSFGITEIINIVLGAFIFIFAYFGFDLLLRLHAESTIPSDIPPVIHKSIITTIIIYTLIGIVIIAVNGDSMIKTTKPLSVLINTLTNNKFIIKYIELCGSGLTWNTVLLSITYCSRLITEFAQQYRNNNNNKINNSIMRYILEWFSTINSTTKTPINTVSFIGLIVLLGILSMNNIMIGTILANGGVLIVMILVYLSNK